TALSPLSLHDALPIFGLLNTGACLESLGRAHARAWTDSPDWTKDAAFMDRLAEWCETGRIAYAEDEVAYSAPVSPAALRLARERSEEHTSELQSLTNL